MTPEALFENLLLASAGNATYDGIKNYLTAWKGIVLPSAKSNDELMDKIELLLRVTVQNLETQTFMMVQLDELKQKVKYVSSKSQNGTTIKVESGSKIGYINTGDNATIHVNQTVFLSSEGNSSLS